MRMLSKAAILLLFSMLGVALAKKQKVEDPVLHLTSANFTDVTEGKDFIILFFSPYCSHCQRFKPTWKDFAASVQGKIGVGDVDW